MRFKNSNQRKAVMAKLKNSSLWKCDFCHKPKNLMEMTANKKTICGVCVDKNKNKTYNQLRNRGIKLKPYADNDKDGVINMKDCKPLNPKEQGLIHDIIKKKQQYVKAREKKLEKTQDNLLKKIDEERTSLKKHLQVQKQINDNKKLKQELSELKKANFYQTTTGRIIAGAGKAARSKTTKKFLKKIFT